MNQHDPQAKTDEVVIPQEEHVSLKRTISGKTLIFVYLVTVLMAIYHIYILAFSPTDPWIFSITHLNFVMVIGFIYYAAHKHFLHSVSILDILLILASLSTYVYVMYHFTELIDRAGVLPEGYDMLFGCLAIITVLELSRRTAGWVLTLLVVVFLIYCVVGPWLPGLLWHKGYSLERIVSYMFSPQGIYNIPLGTTARFVYIFVLFGAFLELSGAAPFFMDFAYAAAGRSRGGPAKVAIISSGLLGMVNGTSTGNVVTTGTGTAVNFGGMSIAGKTGTTSDYNDVWFAGYTPYYTAAGTGYEGQYRNMGETANRGFEATINWVAVNKPNFGLNFNANISFNKSEIKSLGMMNDFTETTKWNSDITGDFLVAVGGEVGQMYGYRNDGRYEVSDFTGYDEVNHRWILRDDVVDSSPVVGDLRPGTVKLKDLTGEGLVNADDQEVVGNANPVHTGGFGMNMRVAIAICVICTAGVVMVRGHLPRRCAAPFTDEMTDERQRITGCKRKRGFDPHEQRGAPPQRRIGRGFADKNGKSFVARRDENGDQRTRRYETPCIQLARHNGKTALRQKRQPRSHKRRKRRLEQSAPPDPVQFACLQKSDEQMHRKQKGDEQRRVLQRV